MSFALSKATYSILKNIQQNRLFIKKYLTRVLISELVFKNKNSCCDFHYSCYQNQSYCSNIRTNVPKIRTSVVIFASGVIKIKTNALF